jgi:hypothetical protein
MSAYDKEYFYSFDDYERLTKNQPIPLSSWNDIKFDFYELRFGNGVVVYLLNTMKEASDFKAYCQFPVDKVPYIGTIKDIENRIIFESINRNTKDFNDLCEQLAEGRTHCFLFVPFKLSWQENPADELAALRAKIKK